MRPGNMNWKTAALPVAAFTAALTMGIAYFAGDPGDSGARTGGADTDVNFAASNPHYAPGSPTARRMQAGPSESSIDMFRRVNRNYSSETSSSESSSRSSARKPRTKAELNEFMKQLRADINMDPAAMAAAGAGPGEDGGSQYSGGGGMLANIGQKKQSASTAVTRKSGSGPTRSGASLNSRKSAFSSGRSGGSSVSRSGGSTGRLSTAGSAFGKSETGGSPNSVTGNAFVSGGGRDLSAGSYGSHGGRSGASGGLTDGGSGAGGGDGYGASADAPAMTGGGGQNDSLPPVPIAFIWPRTVDFGTMYKYETAVRQIIVMNIGDLPLKIHGKIINMDDSTPFYVENDKCSKKTLKPGTSCTFRVRFSPRTQKEYITGFEIPTNDETSMFYQSYIEARGVSKYSHSTWWWHQWNYSGGSANRLDFGLVPAGWTMDQELKITNTSGNSWYDIKLDKTSMTDCFSVTSDACSGKNLGSRQTCSVKVLFRPTDACNRKFSDGHYGQYHTVNMDTAAKLYHSRPKFPPYVMEKPVEVNVKGTLKVRAKYDDEHYGTKHRDVLSVPLTAQSSAEFPVKGLARVQHYFFFK